MSRREQPAKVAALLITDKASAVIVADQRDMSMSDGGDAPNRRLAAVARAPPFAGFATLRGVPVRS
jgi:hypothetical protein